MSITFDKTDWYQLSFPGVPTQCPRIVYLICHTYQQNNGDQSKVDGHMHGYTKIIKINNFDLTGRVGVYQRYTLQLTSWVKQTSSSRFPVIPFTPELSGMMANMYLCTNVHTSMKTGAVPLNQPICWCMVAPGISRRLSQKILSATQTAQERRTLN